MTILGTRPAEEGKPVSRKDAERILAGELMQEIRAMHSSLTEFTALVQSQMVNGVLESGTYTFNTYGHVQRNYHAVAGSVIVANLAATTVVISAGGQTGSAPTQGTGVHLIPGNSFLSVPIGMRSFTIWGVAGNQVGLQVFTGLQAFGVSSR